MTDLAERNARATLDTIRAFQGRLEQQSELIKHLERQVAMHSAEINTLRQMVVTAIAARGTGPTSR